MKSKLQKRLDKHWVHVRKNALKAKKYFTPPIVDLPAGMTDFYVVRDIRKHYE